VAYTLTIIWLLVLWHFKSMLCVTGRTVYHFLAGPDVESSFAYWAQLNRFYYFNL